MKRMGALLAVLLSISSASVFAGGGAFVVAIDGSGQTQTKGYAGLAWKLGGKKSVATPDLVVGVRSVKVAPDDRVTHGADLSARFSFVSGFAIDNLRLSYVGGKRTLLANLGGGYAFANQSFFSTVSAQGPYSRAGLDYEFNARKISPYFELLSIDNPRRAKGDHLGCSIKHMDYYVPDGAVPGDPCAHP